MSEGTEREKRTSKRPAWLLEGVESIADVDDDDDAKMPRGVQKRHVYLSNALQLRLQLAQQEQPQQVQQHAQLQTQLEQLLQPKPKYKPKQQATQQQQQQKQKQQQDAAQQQQQQQEDQDVPQRVCLNEYCKSPFESPQWRRGPLGPGTLCNACGTRYARMEAKKKGDKRGAQLKPQDLVEWRAFQEQRQWPLEVREAWVLDTVQARLAMRAQQLEQQQQQAKDSPQQQPQLDKTPGQQQERQQQQQQQTSGPDGENDSTAEQPRCDQGGSTSPPADAPSQQPPAPPPPPQQQPAPQPDSDALQRATASMLCRVQLGAVHSQMMEAKKQRLQQQQQKHPRAPRQHRTEVERLQDVRPPPQPETYDEADISAQLAGLSSRRQQQQQPRQGSGTSRSSSSGQASGSRAAAAGGGDSGGRDTLLQLLAVGEALFKAEEGCTSDDDKADAQDAAPPPDDDGMLLGRGRAGSSSIGAKRSRTDARDEQQQDAWPQQQHVKRTAVPRDKDRFRQLLAEAEDAVRARSGSPALLRPLPPQVAVQGCAAAAEAQRKLRAVPAAAAGGGGRSAPEQVGADAAVAATAAAASGQAAKADPKLQIKPETEQQQQQQAGAAATVVKPDEAGLAAGTCTEATGAPSAALASAVADDPRHSSASPEQQQQQTAQQQKQSLLLHMLSGLLTATLGLPAAPGSAQAGSELRQQVQQVLTDPSIRQLLDACLADQAVTAWLGEFLSKLGIEQGLLQQRLQSRGETPSAAAAAGGAGAAAAEHAVAGGSSQVMQQQAHTAVEPVLGRQREQCSTAGKQACGSSSPADTVDVLGVIQQQCEDPQALQQPLLLQQLAYGPLPELIPAAGAVSAAMHESADGELLVIPAAIMPAAAAAMAAAEAAAAAAAAAAGRAVAGVSLRQHH